MSKENISEFRKKHSGEKENTIKMFISIRDDENATHKNRIEAGKAIARMLGALQPDKVTKGAAIKKAKPIELSKEGRERLDKILAEDREAPVS